MHLYWMSDITDHRKSWGGSHCSVFLSSKRPKNYPPRLRGCVNDSLTDARGLPLSLHSSNPVQWPPCCHIAFSILLPQIFSMHPHAPSPPLRMIRLSTPRMGGEDSTPGHVKAGVCGWKLWGTCRKWRRISRHS